MEVTGFPGNHASLVAGCPEEVSLELGFKSGLEESRSGDRIEGDHLSRGMAWTEVERKAEVRPGYPSVHPASLCPLPCPHRWAAGRGRSTAGGL